MVRLSRARYGRVMPRSARVLRRLAVALASVFLVGAACGPAEPVAGARYAVVARGLAWERVGAEDDGSIAPLTRHDDFADGLPAGWTASVSAEVDAADGGVRVRGVDEVALRGPAPGVVEVSVHHRLVVRAKLHDDVELRVRWRRAGEDFSDERSLVRAHGPRDADGFSLVEFPVRAMRGGARAAGGAPAARGAPFDKARDAAEGVDEFELVLRPAGTRGTGDALARDGALAATGTDAGVADDAATGGAVHIDPADGPVVGPDGPAPHLPVPVEAVVASVTLASDFDPPDASATLRVDRDGLLRTARAHRVDDASRTPVSSSTTPRTWPADRHHERGPVRLEAPLDPGPHDRLRLAFAAAGRDATLLVTVSDTSGRLPHAHVEVDAREGWGACTLDLAPLGGEPTRLVLEVVRPVAADGEGGVGSTAGSARGESGTRRTAADEGGDATHGAAFRDTLEPVAADAAPAVLLVADALRLAPAATPRPDVVLYLVDTLRADRLGVYGHDRPTDPHLAEIADAGVVVERLTAASNWTRPATTSLLTSLDPPRHGNLTHLDRVSDGVTTLAEALADAGYVTTSFVTNYNAGAWSGLDQGFDEAREPTAHGASAVATTLTSAVLADPLAAFLAEHADEQVFVYVHSMDPHQPYRPPMDDLYPIMRNSPEIGRPTDALNYEGEIHHNDRMLARLDEALAASGRADDTLLAVTSDHGEAFGEHGVFAHRSSLHEEQIRVPWVLRWPAGLPAGRRVAGPITHVDVAPTLLGLAGLRAPDDWRGLDLAAFLRGDGPGGAAPDDSAASDVVGGPGARPLVVRSGPGAPDPDRPLLVHTTHGTAEDEDAHEEVAVLRGGWKLVAGVLDGDVVPRHLYRLTDDPGERADLVGDPAHAAVRAALARWAEDALREGRAASRSEAAEAMDPERRRWMEEMGYLR